MSDQANQDTPESLLRLCATSDEWWCSNEEFERWLAAHDAEVRAEAWDSGYEAGADDQAECEGHRYRDTPEMRERGFDHWRKNPHRKEGPE